MKINKPIALRTTQIFLMAIGSVASVSFLSAMQWWIAVLGCAFSVVLWFIIYKMLEGIHITDSAHNAIIEIANAPFKNTSGSGKLKDWPEATTTQEASK